MSKNEENVKTSSCSVYDVSNYLIQLSNEVGEPLTNMKLQKLLYYSYAWYLVEKKNLEILFSEKILAWQYGPVVFEAYEEYKKHGADIIGNESETGDSDSVPSDSKELIKEVFMSYADKTAIQLMHLTHIEAPWLKSYDASNTQINIPDDLIYDFYLNKKTASLAE